MPEQKSTFIVQVRYTDPEGGKFHAVQGTAFARAQHFATRLAAEAYMESLKAFMTLDPVEYRVVERKIGRRMNP